MTITTADLHAYILAPFNGVHGSLDQNTSLRLVRNAARLRLAQATTSV